MEQALSVLLSSQSNDWYTPPQYIEAARRVMGGIDLDPASSAQANQVVKATTFYDAAVDGLAQPWRGRIYLNSPYGKQAGKSNQEIWTRKLIEEYRAGNVQEAIALVNMVPGYKWWAPLWDYPVCSVGHCIRFLRADGKPAGSAKASSAFIYFGPHEKRFREEFKKFGRVVSDQGIGSVTNQEGYIMVDYSKATGNLFDNDVAGTLEPALKIKGKKTDQLETWGNLEVSKFDARLKPRKYTSDDGQDLAAFEIFVGSNPNKIASMYFGDNGEWWVGHNETVTARRITYHLYNQLLIQGIAVKFTDWLKMSLGVEVTTSATPKVELSQTEPKIKQRHKPELKTVTSVESPPTVKHSPAKLALSKIRIEKFEEFMKAHPTGYTPEKAAKLAINKTYRTIQRDYDLINESMKQSVS